MKNTFVVAKKNVLAFFCGGEWEWTVSILNVPSLSTPLDCELIDFENEIFLYAVWAGNAFSFARSWVVWVEAVLPTTLSCERRLVRSERAAAFHDAPKQEAPHHKHKAQSHKQQSKQSQTTFAYVCWCYVSVVN